MVIMKCKTFICSFMKISVLYYSLLRQDTHEREFDNTISISFLIVKIK
jgi:hypothetical protein